MVKTAPLPSPGSTFASLDAFKLKVYRAAYANGQNLFLDLASSPSLATLRCTTAASRTLPACPYSITATSSSSDGLARVTSSSTKHVEHCANGAFGSKEANRRAAKPVIAGLKVKVKEEEKTQKRTSATARQTAKQAKAREPEKDAENKASGTDLSEVESSSDGDETEEDEQTLAFRALKAAEQGPYPAKSRLKEEITAVLAAGPAPPPCLAASFPSARSLIVYLAAFLTTFLPSAPRPHLTSLASLFLDSGIDNVKTLSLLPLLDEDGSKMWIEAVKEDGAEAEDVDQLQAAVEALRRAYEQT
ncbi:hypothetical protein JCM10213v2_002097 [Rhodosporidiobolus nylandii]